MAVSHLRLTPTVSATKSLKTVTTSPAAKPESGHHLAASGDGPDDIKMLEVGRSTLPPGQYQEVGFERRQLFDIGISRIVTEYRAQILADEKEQRVTAPFPAHVTKAVQYGNGVKAQAVYLSQYQLIPYQRVQDYFQEQASLPISTGSVFNLNQQAFELLEQFELKLISRLLVSPLLHTDETVINVEGKRQWLHCVSNERWTLFYAHAKRGTEAMNTKGVLPHLKASSAMIIGNLTTTTRRVCRHCAMHIICASWNELTNRTTNSRRRPCWSCCKLS